MTYRSDLEAAQARAEALEKQLAEAQAENAELKRKANPPPAAKPRQRARSKPAKPSRPRRGIRYEMPLSFAPLFKLWWAGLRWITAWLFTPYRPASDNVAVYLLQQLTRLDVQSVHPAGAARRARHRRDRQQSVDPLSFSA